MVQSPALQESPPEPHSPPGLQARVERMLHREIADVHSRQLDRLPGGRPALPALVQILAHVASCPPKCDKLFRCA